MAVLNNTGIRAGASASGETEPYLIKNSLRFNDNDTAYLSKTLTSAGDLRKWTYNFWVKRGNIGTSDSFFGCRPGTSNDTTFSARFEADGTIKIATESENIRQTTPVFRDPGTWMMITIIMDTANGTADDRCQIWVNGSRITAFGTNATITQSREFGWNKAAEMNVGRLSSLGYYADCMYADIYFIDSQALEPSAFGSLDANGTWQPKEPVFPSTPSGNSFNFKFEDPVNIGEDFLTSKLSTATQGLPIYATTDDYGLTRDGTTIRADSFKSTLVLAVPFIDSIADISNHADLRNSGSAITLTAGNASGTTPALSTADSKFYGTSGKFIGTNTTGGYVDFTLSSGLGSGDFTIEYWAWEEDFFNYKSHISSERSGGNGFNTGTDGSADFIWADNQGGGVARRIEVVGGVTAKQWNHWAFCRNGTTLRGFLNGKFMGKFTTSYDYSEDTFSIGKMNNSGSHSEYYNGYIQDVKIYRGSGSAKYTTDSGFTTPAGNDWAGTNLTATTGDEAITDRITWTDVATHTKDFGTIGHLQTVAMARHDQAIMNAMYVNDARLEDNGITYSAAGRFSYENGAVIMGGYPVTNIFDNDDATHAKASNGNQPNSRMIWSAVAVSDLNIKDVNFKARAWSDVGGYLEIVHTKYKTQDILVDSPTSYLPDGGNDGAGGVTRGNYPTFNPLHHGTNYTFSNGNLTASNGGGWYMYLATHAIPKTGKWYWECRRPTSTWLAVGISDGKGAVTGMGDQYGCQYVSNHGNLDKRSAGSGSTVSSWGDTWTSTSDIIGVAYDADNEKIWFSKNGTWQNTSGTPNPATGADPAMTGFGGTEMFPMCNIYISSAEFNFGQRAFNTAAPSGFSTLCLQNFPDPSISDPSTVFDAKTYTGTGSSLEIDGLNFKPDLLWFKSRSNAAEHHLQDAVRGVTKMIQADTNAAEITDSNLLTSFDADGFTLPADSSGESNNVSGWTWVSWAWDAGTAAATASTSGSVTPSAQWKNATAGFSISKWTVPGSGSVHTIGHGLSAKPELILMKNLSTTDNWDVYHKSIGANYRMQLNSSADQDDQTGPWNDTEPTNTVFSTQGSDAWYASGEDIITYCWAPISGYSAFGEYLGNGASGSPNALGTFIYTGFLPKFIIIKRYDGGTKNWRIFDTARSPYNYLDETLEADMNDSEDSTSGNAIDVVSNGFTMRGNAGELNLTNDKYLYCAWAERPFKLSRGH